MSGQRAKLIRCLIFLSNFWHHFKAQNPNSLLHKFQGVAISWRCASNPRIVLSKRGAGGEASTVVPSAHPTHSPGKKGGERFVRMERTSGGVRVGGGRGGQHQVGTVEGSEERDDQDPEGRDDQDPEGRG